MKFLRGAATASLLGLCTISLPAFAQYSLFYEQPNVGALHVKEAELDTKLTRAYKLGLIDPLELANMRRDLDAIRVKEESYRMNNNGLTSGGAEHIADRLDQFEQRLTNHSVKQNVIAVPVIEMK
ncbi:MAG TPA: hypothetical protein V6C72_13690 [Chroococcales cyanobacterium]